MMSYLRPLNFQPNKLELIAQEGWLCHVMRLLKNEWIYNLKEGGRGDITPDGGINEQYFNQKYGDLKKYLDKMLPKSVQENAFHRGAQLLRKELSCTFDPFPPFFQIFWRDYFKFLNLSNLSFPQDRISILEYLINIDADTFETEFAKFRLFDHCTLNIEESYLMKRTLRKCSNLITCVLWKIGDDAMLGIIGNTCYKLEALDLWKSSGVTDSGIQMLLNTNSSNLSKLSGTLRRVVIKDTGVTALGALEIALNCPKLEIMDLNQGDLVQNFFGMIREHKVHLPLKSLFFPILEGGQSAHEIIQTFPYLEDLTLWTVSPYLRSFESVDLKFLHSLKLGGLHSSNLLNEMTFSIGKQLTALKIETMHSQINVDSIGSNCPNLEEFHVINTRVDVEHDCFNDDSLNAKPPFTKLKLIYFFLVQYTIPTTSSVNNHVNKVKSALHCILNHGFNIEGVKATGSQELTDSDIKEILTKHNKLLKLKRFVLTSPFTYSSDPPQVPLSLTGSSAILLTDKCPKLFCIGDLRHWNINANDRKLLLKKAHGWISNSDSNNSSTSNPLVVR